jgi:hypothetical protein
MYSHQEQPSTPYEDEKYSLMTVLQVSRVSAEIKSGSTQGCLLNLFTSIGECLTES